jgi:hypothetical protein
MGLSFELPALVSGRRAGDRTRRRSDRRQFAAQFIVQPQAGRPPAAADGSLVHPEQFGDLGL